MKKRSFQEIIEVVLQVLYHVFVIGVSAAVALSLPTIVTYVANWFSITWTMAEADKVILLCIEIAFAVLCILVLHYAKSVFIDRRFSKMARVSGLISVSLTQKFLGRRQARQLKEQNGIARDILVIGSTGARTFADETGDLHTVIGNCREAKIMLLNPFSDGAAIRAKCIQDPEITIEKLREQVRRSIEFLRTLKLLQKNIRLKLYSDVPFLKMVISGDYLWLKHYHGGIDVQAMPEYVFRHNQSDGSLYTFFYQYFLRSWNSREIPEYDFETDELVYRDDNGNELRRECFPVEQPLEPAFA